MRSKNGRKYFSQVRRKLLLSGAAASALWAANLAIANGPLDQHGASTYYTADPIWMQSAFHPEPSSFGPGFVAANFSKSGIAYTVARRPVRSAPSALSAVLIPASSGALTLAVNLTTGDVYVQAAQASTFTAYDLFDKSNNLLNSADPNTDMNERLLSAPSSSGLANTTTYRNATNYKLWSIIQETTGTLAEGESIGKYKQGVASTYDTINIPSGGTIDFGDIYNTVSNVQDLVFGFAEADVNGNPVTGPSVNSAPVFYIGQSSSAPSSYWKDSAATGNWSNSNNWSALRRRQRSLNYRWTEFRHRSGDRRRGTQRRVLQHR